MIAVHANAQREVARNTTGQLTLEAYLHVGITAEQALVSNTRSQQPGRPAILPQHQTMAVEAQIREETRCNLAMSDVVRAAKVAD